MSSLPTYDQLPIDSKYPLILLGAIECAKTGQVFALNWQMEKPYPTLLGRDTMEHKLVPLVPGNLAFDDHYNNYNTQTSSQWDGFLHFSLLSHGNSTTMSTLQTSLGIHHLARRGIAARAVLLDYKRWAANHRPDFDPFKAQEITVDELKQVAEAQKVTFRPGDILLLRTGWIEKHDELTATGDMLSSLPDPKACTSAGIKACDETFAWLWDNHFAACASDNVALEMWPPQDYVTSCHSMLLGAWGMHIGEHFYLEDLVDSSAKDGIYECLFTSAPLNKFKGVASPPNAICIK